MIDATCVILSEAKDLGHCGSSRRAEVLRCAQDDTEVT